MKGPYQELHLAAFVCLVRANCELATGGEPSFIPLFGVGAVSRGGKDKQGKSIPITQKNHVHRCPAQERSVECIKRGGCGGRVLEEDSHAASESDTNVICPLASHCATWTEFFSRIVEDSEENLFCCQALSVSAWYMSVLFPPSSCVSDGQVQTSQDSFLDNALVQLQWEEVGISRSKSIWKSGIMVDKGKSLLNWRGNPVANQREVQT